MNFLLGTLICCFSFPHTCLVWFGLLLLKTCLFFINRYFPFGVDGMLAGSATVFFAYVGFDAVTSTAEEV